MRICILIEAYFPLVGGTPVHARLLARDLKARGHEVLFITRKHDADLPSVEPIDGCQVHRVGPVGHGAMKKWQMLFSSIPALWRRRHDYDLIYVPGFRVIGVSAVVFAKLFRKHCVLRGVSCGEMTGAFFDSGAERSSALMRGLLRLFLTLRNALLRGADRWVAISHDLEDELRACGVPAAKVACIPNAVDVAHFSPVSTDDALGLRATLAPSVPPDSLLAIYTGRLVRYKGIMPLLQAWTLLMAEGAGLNPAHLLLVGGGGLDIHNCEDEARAFVAENGLATLVHFVGDVSNVADYLQASDLFVFPTENEAFGISLIEAMACGLPVVSTDVGGISDYLSDDVNGLVFAPGDSEALAASVRRMVSDVALRQRLGDAALETVRTRFASDLVADRYAELFVSVIQAD